MGGEGRYRLSYHGLFLLFMHPKPQPFELLGEKQNQMTHVAHRVCYMFPEFYLQDLKNYITSKVTPGFLDL